MERYQDRVFRLALRVLRDEEQARDAVQDAFLKVYQSLRRFDGHSSFYTWVYRLVLNLCLDLKRRDRSGREVEWDDARELEGVASELPASFEGGADAPADAVLRKELRRQIAAAIDGLPEVARETLVLREVDGLSYAEIAETLGIPKGTVMSRLHYARKRVQEALVEAGAADVGPGESKEEA